MHVRHPVAQRVGDELQTGRIVGSKGISGAGVVGIQPVARKAVVRLIVEPAKRQRGADLVAFGGVVVDDVENHLESRRVQRFDHRLELAHLAAMRTGRRVAGVWCEETERVVAPVVRQAAAHQRRFADEVLHRHEFDRGDAERSQVRDCSRVRKPGEGAAQLGRHIGVLLGEAAHVQLVDDGVGPADRRRAVAGPIEIVVHDDRLRHERSRVAIVAGQVTATLRISEHRVVEYQVAVERQCVRIDQQLVRIEARSVRRVEHAVDAIAVARAGADAAAGSACHT